MLCFVLANLSANTYNAGMGYGYKNLVSDADARLAACDSVDGVLERYECDAYGNVHILDADFTADADGVSDIGNEYYFTGRRLDLLDNGDLELMYYRNRYYSPELGRFLTKAPLGITPNGTMGNEFFAPDIQYTDGVNLYQYALSNPITNMDALGLSSCDCNKIEKILCSWKITRKTVEYYIIWNASSFFPMTAGGIYGVMITEHGMSYQSCYFGEKECDTRVRDYVLIHPDTIVYYGPDAYIHKTDSLYGLPRTPGMSL